MMTESEEEIHARGSSEFIESSVLSTVIPLDAQFDIEEVLSRSDPGEEADSPLAVVPHRQALFFDETVTVYVVLQTTYLGEQALKSCLGRLTIELDAQVVNMQPENQDGHPGEVIYHASIQDNQDPLIVVRGPDQVKGGSDRRQVLVVWKLSAFLVRPRLRLQNPSVVFSATANLKAARHLVNDVINEYLPSQEPSGMNLLEAFKDDPTLNGVSPRLSALRVSRVTPLTQSSKDLVRPLKNMSRQSLKVYPAINARVRYSRPNTTPTNPSVIASLDIDITSFAKCGVNLTIVSLSLLGGSVEELNQTSGLTLPIPCKPQDDLTFLYRLLPEDWINPSKSPLRTLQISITATALLTPICTPTISMTWNTTLDFTPPLNPGYGQPTQPIQRPHRPAQLSIGGSAFETTPTTSSLAQTRPDSLPPTNSPTIRTQRDPSIPDFGVTMTFTGPPPTVSIQPGKPFTWTIFIVNRSDRPRKLALLVLPKRRRTESTRLTRPPSTSYSAQKDMKTADAFIDENIVHAMHRNSAVESTDIVCLSTDTRVGPLAPQACHEVELRFIALRVGMLEVEVVRVVDLGTQEHVDVGDLPAIMVSPLPAGEEE